MRVTDSEFEWWLDHEADPDQIAGMTDDELWDQCAIDLAAFVADRGA